MSKLNRLVTTVASLADQWRTTRRRGTGGVVDGLRETGEVLSQQVERSAVAAVHRVNRLRPGGGESTGSANARPIAAKPATTGPAGAKSVSDRRLQAVLLCYACVPGAGSEEGVGWTWAEAAAAVADVTVLTTPFAAEGIRVAARERGLAIEVIEVEPARLLRATATRRWGGFVYYIVWQRAAARVLRRHEANNRVDVFHHVTWASDSSPSALTASKAPVRIWGPVGGSTHMPLDLYRFLSPRSRFDEVVRDLLNGSIRRFGGDRVARHATLVLALNQDVAARFRRHPTPLIIEPNCALDQADLVVGGQPITPADGSLRTAVFAARLMGWKGPLLAVEALVHAPAWRLVVFGEGKEQPRMVALAEKLGVTDRVEFRGRVSRSEVLEAFATADALLFPSFHDSAPWAVGEASALGCPVVCLDAGGPPLLAGNNAHVVALSPGSNLAERLGHRLTALKGRGQPEDRWRADRLPDLLGSWYRGATAPDQEVSV